MLLTFFPIFGVTVSLASHSLQKNSLLRSFLYFLFFKVSCYLNKRKSRELQRNLNLSVLVESLKKKKKKKHLCFIHHVPSFHQKRVMVLHSSN